MGPLRKVNQYRELTEDEKRAEIYDVVRKAKGKGYVRLITSVGMINLELACDMVPRTTDNFLRLCEKSYYDGTIFHRLIKNFMVQGGDPTGTGKGGQSAWPGGKSFRDEMDSRLTHQGPGIVSMANSGKDTNRSQFFITLKSCQHLDLKHSIFGRVVGGLNLLEVLNKWETDDKDRPVEEVKLVRTEVFKNPFTDAVTEAAKPKVEEKQVDPSAQWFSNRSDPMEKHSMRASSSVGKYLSGPASLPLPGEKRKKEDARSCRQRKKSMRPWLPRRRLHAPASTVRSGDRCPSFAYSALCDGYVRHRACMISIAWVRSPDEQCP